MSLDELRGFAFGPGVVGDTQMDAVGDSRVIEEEEDVDGIGVGINENSFAVNLEGTCEGLTSIGDEAVADFETVNIGLVFLKAAESVAESTSGETENRDEEEKSGERGPIMQGTNAPSGAGTGEKPANGAIAQIKKNEEHRGKEEEPFPDVAEDVVAHFVAKIGENFIGGFLSESGVPDDDALGSAEAVDGGVGSDGFVAGLHPEHALGGNFLPGAVGDALELGDKLRSVGGEWLVFVEERIDDIGRDEDAKQKERQRDGPEVEPPVAGTLSNDGVENPDEQAADDDGDELSLGPIREPGGPGLDGDFVQPQDGFLKKVDRKFENGDGQNEERGKNEGLEETVAGNFFGPVAIRRGELASENEPEAQEAVEEFDDVSDKTDAAAIVRFSIEIGWESVGGDSGLRLRLSTGGSC